MELVTDAEAAAKFIQAVIPAGMIAEAEKAAAVAQATDIEKPAPRLVTREELTAASSDEYKDLIEKIGSGEVILENE
jgi:hypothetical protein